MGSRKKPKFTNEQLLQGLMNFLIQVEPLETKDFIAAGEGQPSSDLVIPPFGHPKFMLFSTKITPDLMLEKGFICRWCEIAFRVIGPEKQDSIQELETPVTLGSFLPGLYLLIEHNLKHLQERTSYTTDANWELAYPKRIPFRTPMAQLSVPDLWGNEFRAILALIRESHRKQVAAGNHDLAMHLLNIDGTWIASESFRSFVQMVWEIGMSRKERVYRKRAEKGDADLAEIAENVSKTRRNKEIETDKSRFRKAVHHWFKLREKSPEESERETFQSTLVDHFIDDLFEDPTTTINDTAKRLLSLAPHLKLSSMHDDGPRAITFEKYAREYQKSSYRLGFDCKNAEHLRSFIAHPLGMAFMSCAPYDYQAAQQKDDPTFIYVDDTDFMRETGLRLHEGQDHIKAEKGIRFSCKVANETKLRSLGVPGFRNDELVKVAYLGDNKWRIRAIDSKSRCEFKWEPNH